MSKHDSTQYENKDLHQFVIETRMRITDGISDRRPDERTKARRIYPMLKSWEMKLLAWSVLTHVDTPKENLVEFLVTAFEAYSERKQKPTCKAWEAAIANDAAELLQRKAAEIPYAPKSR